MKNLDLSRRGFVKKVTLGGTAFFLAPHWARMSHAETFSKNAVSAGFLTDEEREVLSVLADSVYPDATELGAVDYIEQLLTAFNSDPPKIYAGGPFSGREPYPGNGVPSEVYPKNDFQNFLPLNRVQEASWRLYLYGSSGVEGGGPNDDLLGSVVGLREQFKKNLKGLPDLPSVTAAVLWPFLEKDFAMTLKTLVAEGCFCAPEYGGNKDLKGWQDIQYEGDSAPLGYSIWDETIGAYRERPDAPVSTFNPGIDKHPLSFFTRLFLRATMIFTGGRINR